MWSLETLGRVRLSKSFYMRDFLYSEIANFHGIQNIPEDPDLAIRAGRQLCEQLLEPLQDTFGRVAVRSAYRSPTLNAFGNANKLNCASNDYNHGRHIWDQRDPEGMMGAGASIVIPWFADQYDNGRDWQDLAWWIHDNLPYSEMWFFPKLAAFNLTWREVPLRTISSYIPPRGKLLAAGAAPGEGADQRAARYRDFPQLKGAPSPDADIGAAVRAVYDRQAETYAASRGDGAAERVWIDHLLEGLPTGAPVLDLGCGTGAPLAAHVRSLGYRVTGVDFSPAMIALAKRDAPDGDWQVGDMRRLDLGARFDAIYAWGSFFHLTPEEQRVALPGIAAHLNPGGRLLMTVGPRAGEVTGQVGSEKVYHASLAPGEYVSRLEAAGLEFLEYRAEDPDCGGHTILMAQKRG